MEIIDVFWRNFLFLKNVKKKHEKNQEEKSLVVFLSSWKPLDHSPVQDNYQECFCVCSSAFSRKGTVMENQQEVDRIPAHVLWVELTTKIEFFVCVCSLNCFR